MFNILIYENEKYKKRFDNVGPINHRNKRYFRRSYIFDHNSMIIALVL